MALSSSSSLSFVKRTVLLGENPLTFLGLIEELSLTMMASSNNEEHVSCGTRLKIMKKQTILLIIFDLFYKSLLKM